MLCHQRKVENSIKLINTLLARTQCNVAFGSALIRSCHKSGFVPIYFHVARKWTRSKIDVNAKIINLPARVGVQVEPMCTLPKRIHCRRPTAIVVECQVDGQ